MLITPKSISIINGAMLLFQSAFLIVLNVLDGATNILPASFNHDIMFLPDKLLKLRVIQYKKVVNLQAENRFLIFIRYCNAAVCVLLILPSKMASSISFLIIPTIFPSLIPHSSMISFPRTGD